MSDFSTLERLATELPDTTIAPHHDKIAFRIGDNIYLTYSDKTDLAVVKLSTEQQSILSESIGSVSPVPNKWGQKGWTQINLCDISDHHLKDIISLAYHNVKA